MYVLWPESLLSIIKLGSETTVEYKHSSASTGINYGCSPSRCPPIIEKHLYFLQLLTPFPTNIFCPLPIVLTSLRRYHDNSSTDISSTTLRLQTFRLQIFHLL